MVKRIEEMTKRHWPGISGLMMSVWKEKFSIGWDTGIFKKWRAFFI